MLSKANKISFEITHRIKQICLIIELFRVGAGASGRNSKIIFYIDAAF